jgi:PPOX class probable F420-dependent enzyme
MATPPLPDDLSALLEQPNPAVIATLGADGRPVSVATWYVMDGGDALVSMDATRKRLEHLRRDPRVSLTVLDGDDWYRHVTLRGRVVELRDDEGLADIDRISTHYRGQAYSHRTSPRVTARIAVERWHGWHGGRPLERDA